MLVARSSLAQGCTLSSPVCLTVSLCVWPVICSVELFEPHANVARDELQKIICIVNTITLHDGPFTDTPDLAICGPAQSRARRMSCSATGSKAPARMLAAGFSKGLLTRTPQSCSAATSASTSSYVCAADRLMRSLRAH